MVMIRKAPIPNLDKQVATRLTRSKPPPVDDTLVPVVSTGSTLLDLAISGGRFEQGGLPGGILVEIFGPSSSGKTVMLCEIAGAVQRGGGEVMFRDPEGRLNKQFASLFGFNAAKAIYDQPDTVVELFEPVRKWAPNGSGAINAVFADSLAALSTEMELKGDDKYGMRRAKDFSEQCRLVCRELAKKNLLMVCSNQIRQNLDAGPFGEKYKSPGGEAIGFYASLRLRCYRPSKISLERSFGSSKEKRVIGVQTMIEVYKSSVWEPFHTAPVTILYDYGVDDVRDCLDFVKKGVGASSYMLGERKLGVALERAIKIIEGEGLEADLKKQTIQLWHQLQSKFKTTRTAKRRV